MENNKILRIVYTFFLGLLIATFIGVGVNTFYESPKSPDFPIEANSYGKDPTDSQIAEEQKFETSMKQYNEEMKPYNRNVSIITLIAAVTILAVSLIFEKKIKTISDGVMLGGLFTLVYSIGRSFASEDTKYTFITVTVGLVIVLYLGYHRFVQEHSGKKTK